MGVGKLSNVDVGDIDNVSSASDLSKISGVEVIAFGNPLVVRLSIANDGDSWDPRVKMFSGSGVIDWGDGTPTESVSTVFPSPHTYATAGTYDVTVTPVEGFLTQITGPFNFSPQDTQVTEVVAFGDCGSVRFANFLSLVTIPLDGYLDLTGIEFFKLQNFRDSSSFVGPTSMAGYATLPLPSSISGCFLGATLFNRPGLNDLDTSSVTNMSQMFASAAAFNQPLDNWNVSIVDNMNNMFSGATAFDQDISGWNVSSVDNMGNMFSGATVFDQDISGWNVSSVTTMIFMFSGAIAFDQDIGAWTFKNSCIISEIFRISGMSDANVALCLEGWDSVGQGTSVDATDMFGSTARTMSESTYPNAKTAYDNLISTYSWDFTGSFNWVA